MKPKLAQRDNTVVKGTRALLYGRLINSPFIVSAKRTQALLPIDTTGNRESSLVFQFDSIYDGKYIHEELRCLDHKCIYLEEENTILLILMKSNAYDTMVRKNIMQRLRKREMFMCYSYYLREMQYQIFGKKQDIQKMFSNHLTMYIRNCIPIPSNFLKL